MTVYTVTKEGGEWKLVKTAPGTDSIYIASSSPDKRDVISDGNEQLAKIAKDVDDEEDGLAVMVVKKTDGSIQMVRSRGYGEIGAEVKRHSDRPYWRQLILKVRPPYNWQSYAGTMHVQIGYYLTQEAAENDAIAIRNGG